MSDTLTLLPPPDHGMDALLQPMGSMTGTAPSMLVTTVMTSPVGQSHDITVGAGGASGSVSDQLAALQAKNISLDLNRSGQSVRDVIPDISSSTRLSNNSGEVASSAGNAASDLLSISNKTLSQPTDPSTGLPKLQFLSDSAAIKTTGIVTDAKTDDISLDKTSAVPAKSGMLVGELKKDTSLIEKTSFSSPEEVLDLASLSGRSVGSAPDTQTYTVPTATSSSKQQTEGPQPIMMLRSSAVALSAYDAGSSYSYEASGLIIINGVTTGWSDQLFFSDNFNHVYPGIVVNSSYDDIGGRRDSAWLQPSMRAYPSSDSGYRAGQFQNWLKDNKDVIGYNVIGTAIPPERLTNLRDWGHDQIKWKHRGNQEVASDILRKLATQDNQTTTQLNNIWHLVLGVAITSAELTDAISQISVGHATLSTERRDLAHSSQAAALYAQKYQDVHGHPPSEADIRFAQEKIGNGASLQQYIWDEAHNGQTAQEFGDVYRQVHGRDPRPVDIEFAQQKIGNGASLQQYRWDEAHNDQTPQEFGDMFRRLTGYGANGDQIRDIQEKSVAALERFLC